MSIEPISHELLHFSQGDRLRKSLQLSGISSQEMADYLEVSRNTISRWINDEREPNRTFVRLWSLRTGVPLAWIETGVVPEDNGGGDASSMVNIYYLPTPSLELVA